ncbi:MAG: alanine/glycine:cation symporter family protein [Bacteroidota bacterium]
MKIIRLLLIAGFSIIFQTSILFSQEVDSTDQAAALLDSVETISSEISVPIKRVGLDKKINDGFEPFGKGVGDVIFYAPVIAEDILYAEKGVPRSEKSFYNSPPFTVDYSYENKPDFDLIYTVEKLADGNLHISYPKTISVPLDEEIDIQGNKLTVSRTGISGAEGNESLNLAVTSTSSLDSYSFDELEIEKGVDLNGLGEVAITYPHKEYIKEGASATVAGVNLAVNPNTESSFELIPGKQYTFQMVEVTFLPFIIIMLLLGATFFTIAFRFINIRKFKLAIDIVRGKYDDPDDEGEVSHFQALSAALSGTVGLGNIAGVAIAISIGGAGATFWMILAGLLGMSTKFVECTLGVKYRRINEKGVVSGGPMYYLSEGLTKRGMAGLGKVAAIFFSIMCIGGSFGGGNMFQVNQAFQQFKLVTGGADSFAAGYAWVFGLIMAGLIAIVIIGGIKSIANVTDKIVPFMCGVYVLAALVIISMNLGEVPRVFGEIFGSAFAPTAVAGGLIGVLIQGFRRAAFSNEAGVGSAPIAHAAVKTKYPASEGLVSLLEPFIDTVVVCTMTALVIIITNNHLDPNASDGVQLTSAAFSGEIPFFQYILAVAVILFAFSTMITWSYYGLKAWTYLFGDSKLMDTTYKILFCVFVVIGSAATLTSVTDFSDAMIFAMSFPNIIGLVILLPEVREELAKYLDRIKELSAIKVK